MKKYSQKHAKILFLEHAEAMQEYQQLCARSAELESALLGEGRVDSARIYINGEVDESKKLTLPGISHTSDEHVKRFYTELLRIVTESVHRSHKNVTEKRDAINQYLEQF